MSKSMTQDEKFLSEDNFRLAFLRLQTAPRNLYKSIYYEDLKIFELFLDENIKSVINQIRQKTYRPEKCHKIFIPKKDNLVRPLSILTFIDLLIYQAMVNVIADIAYETISPYYENIIFGNVINTSDAKKTDNIFFYKSWKKKWKKFNAKSKEYFTNGYKFISEFDIASFFDTIDHNILCDILKDKFKINGEVLICLPSCLEAWTADSNHASFTGKHGIPQGPIGSSFLADLYLFYLDMEIKKYSKKLDFKYIRYVDDIRIFSKDEITSQKLIAALDLFSRDLGLIPQGSKIHIKEVSDIDKELKIQNSNFSDIAKEYKEDNDGKPVDKLKSKTHKKLKNRFLACFDKRSSEEYLDKTLIGFSLYKLNADEEVKSIILSKYNLVLTHFEGILFYLRKHFATDKSVLSFVGSIINDENILFHHLVALCFKYFPDYPFDEKVYRTYTSEKHRHWLVNFYMINWLYQNKKNDFILGYTNTSNYFIQREVNSYKYILSSDSTYQKVFSQELMENSSPLIALHGLSLSSISISFLLGFNDNVRYNPFIRYILTNQSPDIIIDTLKKDELKIEEPEKFFNDKIWSDTSEYEELRTSFLFFVKSSLSDPSKSLLNLNLFNNLVFDKVCSLLAITKPSGEYGVNLNARIIASRLPLCNVYWTEINEKRNQRTEAHPYDKLGRIRTRITNSELQVLYRKAMEALEELCSYRFIIS